MNKTLKLFAIFTVIFGGLLAVWANGVNDSKVEVVGETPSASAPRSYATNCARCHGADGKGQTALGKTLDVPDLSGNGMSAAKIKSIISKGAGSMPAFGKKLKAADITALTNYVRTL